MNINGGRTKAWKASVSPPTAPSTDPKYGVIIATEAVNITKLARITFIDVGCSAVE